MVNLLFWAKIMFWDALPATPMPGSGSQVEFLNSRSPLIPESRINSRAHLCEKNKSRYPDFHLEMSQFSACAGGYQYCVKSEMKC